MKHFICFVLMVALSALSMAQSFIAQTTDLKHFALVTPVKIGTLSNLAFGKIKLGSPDLVALPGLKLVDSKVSVTYSGGVLWSTRLADNLTGIGGLSCTLTDKNRPYPGIMLGVSVKL